MLLTPGRVSPAIHSGDPVAALTLVFIYSVIASAAGMLLGAVARTPAQAVAVAVPGGIVLGMLGGTMWPLTPQAWAMDSWNAIINDGAGLAGIGGYLAVLIGFAVGLSALAVWALGRHARSGR